MQLHVESWCYNNYYHHADGWAGRWNKVKTIQLGTNHGSSWTDVVNVSLYRVPNNQMATILPEHAAQCRRDDRSLPTGRLYDSRTDGDIVCRTRATHTEK